MSNYDPPLLYARLWEDHDVLRQGLRIQPGEAVLSIAAAGDNSFALLLDDPSKVVMLDRNTTQLALCELKMACLRVFEPEQSRRFLGLEPCDERAATYQKLRPELPDRARAVFDRAQPEIEEGLLDTGKFERYLAMFRTRVLPLVQWRSTVDTMVGLTDLQAQSALYDRKWNSLRWRLLFRLFFSRFVMERRGRDKAFFEHVEGRVADVFMGRAKKALTEIPVATNPYLVWILAEKNLAPPYLHDDTYATIRDRLDRIRLVEEDLTSHQGAYDAFNLSTCRRPTPTGF